jgi:hypothetical protein
MMESKGYRLEQNVLLRGHILGPPYLGVQGLRPYTTRALEESCMGFPHRESEGKCPIQTRSSGVT